MVELADQLESVCELVINRNPKRETHALHTLQQIQLLKDKVIFLVLRIRFLGLLDPAPLVRCTDPALDPSIIRQKYLTVVKKTLIPTVL